METTIQTIPPLRKAALAAGTSLFIMAVAAGFAFGYVFSEVYQDGDAAATAAALQNQQSLFSLGLAAWAVIFITDLIVTWGLHQFFKRAAHRLSGWTAIARLVYTLILGVAVVQQLYAIRYPAEGLYYLETFQAIWSAGLIIFGLHLMLLGWLMWRASFVPQFFAVLLFIAGPAYSLIHAGRLFLPGMDAMLDQMEMVLALPMAGAELGLAIWLLARGGRFVNASQSVS